MLQFLPLTWRGGRRDSSVMWSCSAYYVVHGLYPRESYSDHDLDLLLQFLNGNVELSDGRTYAGGLTKFEPKEMERLMVPSF